MNGGNKHPTWPGDRSVCRRFFLAFMSLALVLTGSCKARSLPSPTATVEPLGVATQASQIRAKWEEQDKKLERKTKHFPENRLKILKTILEQSSAEEIKAESERVFTSAQAYVELSKFEQTLIQLLVSRAVDARDRAGLVFMLARKAPHHIATIPLELHLSYKDHDNILIIFESYEQTTAAENKKLLLRALRGSFRDQRDQFKNDEEFLKASKQWYLANRLNLKVNPSYYPFENTSSTKYLFVPRSDPK